MESNTAQVIISIIPIVGIGIGGIIVFFSLLWHHHEVKAQIQTGNYIKTKFDLDTYSLLIGILLTGIGSILTIFFTLFVIISKGAFPALLGGLVPLAVGISLLIFHKVNPNFHQK